MCEFLEIVFCESFLTSNQYKLFLNAVTVHGSAASRTTVSGSISSKTTEAETISNQEIINTTTMKVEITIISENFTTEKIEVEESKLYKSKKGKALIF